MTVFIVMFRLDRASDEGSTAGADRYKVRLDRTLTAGNKMQHNRYDTVSAASTKRLQT
jgi:hypothetical protein